MVLAQNLWIMGGTHIISWDDFFNCYRYPIRLKSASLPLPAFMPFPIWVYFKFQSLGGRVERVQIAKKAVRLSRGTISEEKSKLIRI